MSQRLLLISSSRIYGQEYMAYCHQEVSEFWGERREILFIPYAAHDQSTYTNKVRGFLEPFGLKVRGINEFADPHLALAEAQGVFTGGGNTFLLVHTLHRLGLMNPLRERVLAGMPYMGSSAGSNISCPTLKTTNDMPIIQPSSFETLNLVPFQINPHYLDPEPNSTHMGETRADRIREFHQLNSAAVIGLREGGLLQREGQQMSLKGIKGARLFRANQEPEEFLPGDDLSFLLVDK
jgi:dipeptidase E